MCLRVLAAAFLAAALSAGAKAQDARRGADLAQNHCTTCHGGNGRSQLQDIPSLAGQPVDFITTQMILFREGLRQVPAMTRFAQGLPDRDIEDLAAFFASLPPGSPGDRGARDAALFSAGQALVGPRNCGVCHLSDFRGRNQIPRLTFQREEFLTRTMVEYRDGQRVGADSQMNGAVQGLSNPDIAALAHYLAHRD